VSAAARLRRLAVPPARAGVRGALRLRTRRWAPGSRLFVVGDGGGWSVDEDARHTAATAGRLGFRLGPPRWARFTGGQGVFHASHFAALERPWLDSRHALGAAWLHGRPGTEGHPEFDRAFETLGRNPERFAALQVTHEEMHRLVVEAGVPAERVHRVPIGIDLESFPLRRSGERDLARASLGLPREAFVVGSFQKDGVGWGEGLEPKLVKGPDVLLQALGLLYERAPDLLVLLTGPARGFVREGLDRLAIPHIHLVAESRADLARAYRALDAYVVASRQEGGPKAALEAMASGVPLVSTRVGQVPELGEGVAWLVDVEDAEGLAEGLARAREGDETTRVTIARGREVAERHALALLDPLWAPVLDALARR
jgi:glycosyltransferase involved in cell wall biosynthesis